jgi:hypothetical protein
MATTRVHKSGLEAVRLLRKKKHRQGLPFMINSNTLETNQCYLEYPDGSMKIVEANSKKTDFVIIEDVDPQFAIFLKKKLKLI